MPILTKDNRIYVPGHRGMTGSAVCRALEKQGYRNVITGDRSKLDLTDQRAVFDFFADQRPQVQIICAALVGGIAANSVYIGDFIGQNLMIQTNLLEAARRYGCAKTIFIGSSCIYPRDTAQPMKEEQLLTGSLEETNQWYAIAKLAAIKMGQAYRRQYGLDIISVLPTNLYGPGDNFDLENSHVIPGLMRRFHLAKQQQTAQVDVWGSGTVRREVMHVDDMAKALFYIMRQPQTEELYNIGCGEDMTIAELAQALQRTVGYEGELVFDAERPEGPARKLLNSSRMLALGWRPAIPLMQGLADTYRWFLAHRDSLRETRLNT